MSAIHCRQCGRPNSVKTTRCIWCSAPISRGRAIAFEAGAELGYLEGIDRFEDAGPVRFIVTAEGIEILELMPGSRSVKIPIECVIEARVSRASAPERPDAKRSGWVRAARISSSTTAARTNSDSASRSVLTVKYRLGAEIRSAVFCRDDSNGAAVVDMLARRLSELFRARQDKEAN